MTTTFTNSDILFIRQILKHLKTKRFPVWHDPRSIFEHQHDNERKAR
jgi:hypothetical protein